MYLIFILIIVLSALGIMAIFARKMRAGLILPRDESVVKGNGLTYPKFDEVKEGGQIFRSGKKETIFIFIEKLFRRMRVWLMKFENLLAAASNKLHERVRQKRAVRFPGEEEKNERLPGQAMPTGPLRRSLSEASREEGKSALEGKTESSHPSLIALNETNTEFDENYWILVLKKDAKNPYPYKKLGEIYIAREEYDTAREVLRCALKLNLEDQDTKAKLDGLRGKKTKRMKAAKHASVAQR